MFLQNADRMHIRMLDLDSVALFRGHPDHTGELVALVRYLMEAKIEKIQNTMYGKIRCPCLLFLL